MRVRVSTRRAGVANILETTLRRDRDGLAYISKQFVKFGLTSVCHESGNLHALQQVRD